MPPLHLADLALSAARHPDDDPSAQARRLYDRPDALPLPDPAVDLARMPFAWRLDRIVDVLRGLRTVRGSADETAALTE